MKDGWKNLKYAQEVFYKDVDMIQKAMSLLSKIEGLEFFMCDNEYVGIGNVEKTMKLIQREELEKK
jgi:hypothetical protein